MKNRLGFVSNSSSSSFVVAFPRDVPLTFDFVKSYLFDEATRVGAGDNAVDTVTATNLILSKLATVTKNDESFIENLAFEGLDSYRWKKTKAHLKPASHDFYWIELWWSQPTEHKLANSAIFNEVLHVFLGDRLSGWGPRPDYLPKEEV
jgi:hypothetical protein